MEINWVSRVYEEQRFVVVYVTCRVRRYFWVYMREWQFEFYNLRAEEVEIAVMFYPREKYQTRT
jgi:hypothetical protein